MKKRIWRSILARVSFKTGTLLAVFAHHSLILELPLTSTYSRRIRSLPHGGGARSAARGSGDTGFSSGRGREFEARESAAAGRSEYC